MGILQQGIWGYYSREYGDGDTIAGSMGMGTLKQGIWGHGDTIMTGIYHFEKSPTLKMFIAYHDWQGRQGRTAPA